MKRITLIFTIILAYCLNPISAQTLNQDAEGNSSLVYQGGNIGLDLTKTNLSFSYTNLGLTTAKKDVSKEFKPVWGITAYGKNNEGISDIFKQGQIQPDAGLIGLIGVKYRFDEKPQNLSELENKKKPLVEEKIRLNKEIESLICKTDEANKKRLEDLKIKQNEIAAEIQLIQDERKNINKNRVRRMGLFYLRGGKSGTSFKMVKDNPDSIGLSKIFENHDFSGGFFGFGANYEHGRWLIGLSIDYEFTNNLNTLTKSTFTITTAETYGDETLENKKEIIGYTGDYSTFKRTNINIDAVMFTSLDDDKKSYITWNFYLRHKISNSTKVLPTLTDIGVGAFFFNKENKFLGGVYIEAPDFFQNIERTKDDPDLKEIQKRLTFGVVARFNFALIVGPSF